MSTQVRPGYKLTEAGEIPEDWQAVQLRQKIEISHGFPFASQHFVEHGRYILTTPGNFYEDGGFKYLGAKQKYYTGPIPGNYILKSGDLIVAMTEQADGLLGSAAIIHESEKYLHNQRLGRVRLSCADIDAGYLFYVFNSTYYRSKVRETAAGTKVKHTSPEKLCEIQIPLPSIHEQRAIATALSDIDVLISSLDELITKKRDIKQATMQQLLTGQNRLPKFNGGWEVRKLSDLANIQRGASPRPIDSPVWFDDRSSIGWVRISDVTRSNIFLRETTQRLSALGVKHSRPVNRGSLIMSICATVGRPVITEIETCIHDGFVVFDDLNVNKHFMYYALKFIEGDWSRHGQTGSQMNLNTGLINRTEISIPPDEEQIAIACILSDMDTELSKVESQFQKAHQLKQGMMQELLTGRTRLL